MNNHVIIDMTLMQVRLRLYCVKNDICKSNPSNYPNIRVCLTAKCKQLKADKFPIQETVLISLIISETRILSH